FEVDKEGNISVVHVDAIYDALKDETKRVFQSLPKIQPGTYNGKPTFYQYSLTIKIPLVDPEFMKNKVSEEQEHIKEFEDLNKIVSNEFDSITKNIVTYKGLEYSSQLNIPFTHQYYSRFDANMNGLGTNSHTAAKPFV